MDFIKAIKFQQFNNAVIKGIADREAQTLEFVEGYDEISNVNICQRGINDLKIKVLPDCQNDVVLRVV